MNRKLAEKVEEIKGLTREELVKMHNCKPEQICMGDYIARNTDDKTCPYKVILGFADFENSKVISLGDLEVVYGRRLCDLAGPINDIYSRPIYLGVNLKNSHIFTLNNLKKVYGSLSLNEYIKSMENVEWLGSNLYLNQTRVADLGALKKIEGRLNLEDMKVKLKSLGKLEEAETVYVDITGVESLGSLKKVKSVIYGKHCGTKTKRLFESKFPKYNSENELEM